MSVRVGVYEHYKGKRYQVIGLGKIEATLEDVVIYKPLYEVKEFPQDMFWVRPVKVFTEDVEIDGEMRPRFKYIGEESA